MTDESKPLTVQPMEFRFTGTDGGRIVAKGLGANGDPVEWSAPFSKAMMDPSEFCPKCGNILFEDAHGKFCLSCESGRQKTKDKPRDDLPRSDESPLWHAANERLKRDAFVPSVGTRVVVDDRPGTVAERLPDGTVVIHYDEPPKE